MLEEKEQKRKKELELKEQKKQKREEKKRKREEDQKWRQAECVRKTEAKAKQKEEKEAQKAHKATPNQSTTRSTRSSSSPLPLKKARVQDETIDENVCCVFFISYGEDVQNKSGKEWVMCACSCWLHEDCAEDCIVDSNGKERFCPFC